MFGGFVEIILIKKMLRSLFIILSLFFSFSVFAGDDLTGKQIYCSRIAGSDGFISALAVRFINDEDVVVYHQRNDHELKGAGYQYHAYGKDIRIHSEIYVQNQCSYMIDRTNLNIEYCYADRQGYKSFLGKWCRLTESNLKELFVYEFNPSTNDDNLL